MLTLVEQRTISLIKALFLGYIFETSNGMKLGIDEESKPYIVGTKDGEEYLIPAHFPLDVNFLINECEQMTDEQYFQVCTFIALNNDKKTIKKEVNE